MADNKEYEILIDGEDDIEIETDSVSYLPFDNKTINQNSKGEMQAIGITNGTDIIDYDTIKEGLDKPASQPFEFETKKDFEDWLNGTFTREDGRTTDDLLIGNDVYIVEKSVPDYWCKSVTKPFSIEKNFEEIETDVDDKLSDTSINPVQNKVITEALKDKQQILIAGTNMEIKDNVISSEIPKSSATVLGGVFLYKVGTVWNIDLAGNDPVVRIPEGTTIVENAMLKTDMESLYIPNSVIQSNVSIEKDMTYTIYRELHCDMDLQQFLNIQVSGYAGSLGGYSGSGVDLYLKEVKQDTINVLAKYGITTLGYQLCGIGMTELTLEEGIERIQGIEYCSNLTTLRLPASLKTIDSYGLARNNNLKDIYYAGTKSQWAQITLGNNYNQGSLFEVVHCSDGDLDLVVKGPIVRVPDGVTTLTLANLATDMETLIIPDSIVSCDARINKQTYKVYNRLETTKSLEDFLAIEAVNNDYRNAISGYGNTPKFGGQLTDLVINDKVQTTITVPGTVKDAGYNLSSLSITELTLEEGVTILGCAGYCHELTKVNLPSTLTTIGNRGFYNCTNLTTLNYAGTMAQWANVSLNKLWYGSTSLTVVHCSDGDVTL